MFKPRVIAFYLPQFHPIPENDEWWGKGFTEWTNVGKAKKYFPGHYQPRVPADLGYYDLRVPETREAQAELAREAGIEGFCYWHYWFGNGKRLLERPFNEVLESGKPDFPFCLAWANETWKGFSHGLFNRNVLIEQLYPGVEDYVNHFYTVLPAFKDKRYIKVDGKPLFMIYKPLASHDIISFIHIWRNLAKENGLEGIYFVGQSGKQMIEKTSCLDLDAINTIRVSEAIGPLSWRNIFRRIVYAGYRRLFHQPVVIPYRTAYKYFFDKKVDMGERIIPTIISGWDHTPRSGWHGLVFDRYIPKLFYQHASEVITSCKNKKCNIIFLKSWNEWAEGNYLEPDIKWGRQYLDTLENAINI